VPLRLTKQEAKLSLGWPTILPHYRLLVGLISISILQLFEILGSKRIWVTSLTFQGHVTSSVTWPFDTPYAISYWWCFGTKPLSLTVSEILMANVTQW